MEHDSARQGILVVTDEDPKLELAFELAFLRSLTVQERFNLMFRRSREMVELLRRHGNREPAAIVERS